jgi:hypothetical protein
MQLSDTTKQFDDFFQENADFFSGGFSHLVTAENFPPYFQPSDDH